MEKLKEALKRLQIPFDDYIIEKFRIYMEGILFWNQKINLTAITDPADFIGKHFTDSVLCYSFREYINAKTVIDMGTGAGFPGIPLAILSGDKNFVLVDSIAKRLAVINELAGKAGIKNVTTVHGRAEDLGKNPEFRESFDLCLSRAVAGLATLSEYCLPFVKTGGHFLAYKGPVPEIEAEAASNAIRTLGGMLIRTEAVPLPGFDHHITVIGKIGETPAKYPRKAGIPAKRPIS